MRIDRLDLIAFGCFTDRSLDLSGPGVHVVTGPNEAGKSTARHALDQLLYGLDRQTSYDFVHPMRELRLGALLRDGAGGRLEVVRHKRDKNALTRPDGTPLDQVVLTRMLGGVGREDFRAVFALDHKRLREGGAELLAGGGEIGRALFESRSSARLGAVLDVLDRDSGALWKSGGKKPSINAGLAELSVLRRRVQDGALVPETFAEHVKALRRAEEECARRAADLKDTRARVGALDRLRQALPALLQRAALREEAAALKAEGPVAHEGIAAELEAVEARVREARAEADRDRSALDDVEEELGTLTVDDAVLGQAAAIEALHAEVRAVRDAADLARDAEDGLWQTRERARELLAAVRPGRTIEDTGAYEVPAGVADRVAGLREELSVCESDLAKAEEQVALRTARLAEARERLADIPEPADPQTLRALLKAVPGGLVDKIADAERALRALEGKAGDLRARQGEPWSTVLAGDAAPTLAVPARARVTAHLERAERHRAALDALTGDEAEIRKRHDGHVRDLETLLRSDPPPTAAELASARAARDTLWAALRTGERPGTGRADAYEAAVAVADGVADRIRERAEEAARRTRLEVDVERDVVRLAGCADERRRLQDELTALAGDWSAMWEAPGLPVPDPDTAPALLDAVEDLTATLIEARAVRGGLEELRARAAELVGLLRAALEEAGAPTTATGLGELVELADVRRDVVTEVLKRRERAQEVERTALAELEEAGEALTRARDARKQWQERWTGVIHGLDLPDGGPAEAAAAVAALDEVARLVSDMTGIERRRSRAAEQVEAFVAGVAAVLDTLGRPVPEGAEGETVLGLHEELTRARAADETRSRLREQRRLLSRRVRDGLAAADRAQGELGRLVTAAGVADVAALKAAVVRGARLRSVEEAIAGHETLLNEGGMPVADAEREAARFRPGELVDIALPEAERAAEQAQADYDRAGQELGRLRQVVDGMDDSAEAARAEERVAARVAAIADDTEQYIRLRLAREVLLRCMEEYRRNNQDPVLARAESVFRELTDGRFARLVTDTDAKGEPVLRACRSGAGAGEPIGVGEMSEGTRDQLYLALRLASLEGYAEAGRAMPIVLDDIAMTFDDGRTASMLRVLDAMADRFQVVLFTHHAHLGGIARDTLPAGRAHVHELPVFVPPVPAVPQVSTPQVSTREGSAREGSAPRRPVREASGAGGLVCRDCGVTFSHTGRGRPPVRCPEHRS